MSLQDYNPNDPEFLISRSIDGDLSPDEQRMLQELLAQSALLQEEARRMRRVAQLMTQWSATQPNVDWLPHAKLVQAKLDDPADSDHRLEEMLQAWASGSPALDENAFVASVMKRVRPQRRRRTLQPLLRLGAPLAAAAVLAFAVGTFFWAGPQAAPVSFVSIQRSALTIAPSSEDRAVVSFAQEPVEAAGTNDDSAIAFLTLGASPAFAEAAPL